MSARNLMRLIAQFTLVLSLLWSSYKYLNTEVSRRSSSPFSVLYCSKHIARGRRSTRPWLAGLLDFPGDTPCICGPYGPWLDADLATCIPVIYAPALQRGAITSAISEAPWTTLPFKYGRIANKNLRGTFRGACTSVNSKAGYHYA